MHLSVEKELNTFVSISSTNYLNKTKKLLMLIRNCCNLLKTMLKNSFISKDQKISKLNTPKFSNMFLTHTLRKSMLLLDLILQSQKKE